MSRLLLEAIVMLLSTVGMILASTYIFCGLDKPGNEEERELARRFRTAIAVLFEMCLLIAICDSFLTEDITP